MSINILLVDDEPLVIQDIAASVAWSSLNVQHVFLAYSASEAMREFDLHHIELLICDIEMPKVNGLKFLA